MVEIKAIALQILNQNVCSSLYLQEELTQICVENDLKWIEDPSNSFPVYWRNAIRQVVVGNPHLKSGLRDIIHMCNSVRDRLEEQGAVHVHVHVLLLYILCGLNF